MSIRSTKREISELLGGRVTGTLDGSPFMGVEYDSRAIKGGELFVALKGEVVHGHQFVEKALEQGAALVLVENEEFLTKASEPERVVVVRDTQESFWRLAAWWRKKLGTPIVAITGSVGKTTTKELLAALLMQTGPGNYALKSFNNHVGVPYTLLRTAPHHGWAVVEIGMNRPGEIAALSKIVEPTIALVTEVQAAHIGAFSTGLRGIAEEKLSIAEGLRDGGLLIVNGDNEHIEAEAVRKNLRERVVVKTVGSGRCDYRVSNAAAEAFAAIRFSLSGGSLEHEATFHVPIVGIHNAVNASFAVAAAISLFPEITTEALSRGFRNFSAPLMRMNLKELPDGRRVLDDSYNANPASMKAMLSVAGDAKAAGLLVGLVVGDMKELGELSEQYHREVGECIAELRPSFVVAVGEFASLLIEAALRAGVKADVAPSAKDAAEIVKKEKFDMLFVKGSRGVGLDETVVGVIGSE